MVLALTMGLTAELAVSAADGPRAVSAGKKGKKARKKAKKYLQNATWTNIQTSSVTGSSTTTRITFCPNGRYSFRKDNDSIVAASVTTFDGTWVVKTANLKTGVAKVKYTVQNFQSTYFDGSAGPDSPPPSPSILRVQATTLNQAFFDGIEFSRGAASC
jgi:hypothetical protein